MIRRYTPREIAHSYDSAFRGEGTDPPLCMYVRASAYDALAARCAELVAAIDKAAAFCEANGGCCFDELVRLAHADGGVE